MTETKIITKIEKGANRHWKNFLDKDYLGSHNLEKGEEMLLTIEKFEGEEMVNKIEKNEDTGKKVVVKVPKQVLYFKEDAPKMIMNITNGNTLSTLYGSHPDGWMGKKILVYAARVKAFGVEQDALRIRDVIPKRDIDVAAYVAKLSVATTQTELKAIWITFPRSAIADADLVKAKDELKSKLPA